MHEFRNWRWFRRYSGGVISDLGAHQIDVFNWMLGSNPVSVIAGGGRDYYTNHEWYDNVFAIYEYPTEDQVVRTSYQVLTTDRKSTRLNSSHLGISYAVFCLK